MSSVDVTLINREKEVVMDNATKNFNELMGGLKRLNQVVCAGCKGKFDVTKTYTVDCCGRLFCDNCVNNEEMVWNEGTAIDNPILICRECYNLRMERLTGDEQ